MLVDFIDMPSYSVNTGTGMPSIMKGEIHMKYDEFISVIASDVGRILEENTANIVKDLLANIPQDQPCI